MINKNTNNQVNEIKEEPANVMKDDFKQIKIENKFILYLIRLLPLAGILYVYFMLLNSLVLYGLIYQKVNNLFPDIEFIGISFEFNPFKSFVTIMIIILLVGIPTYTIKYTRDAFRKQLKK